MSVPAAKGGGRRGLGGVLLRLLRSLRAQLLLWTILPIAVFLLGLSFTDVYGHQRAMRILVEERDGALAQLAAGHIADYLSSHAAMLAHLAADPALPAADSSARQQLLQPFEAPFSQGVALIDGRGRLQASTPAARAWAQASPVATLARAASEHDHPVYLAGTLQGLPGPSLAVAVPLPQHAGALVGVLPLSSSAIPGVVGELQVAPQAQVSLLDAQGQPIQQAGPSHAGHSPEGLVTTTTPVPYTDWRIILSEPWHQLVPLVLRYAQATVLIAIAAVLVSLLAVYSGVRYVTRPLLKLGQQARRMAWGDFQAVENPVGGVEEIADLQQTLRQLTAQVRGYQAAMRSYVAAVTQAQEEERRRLARELHDDTVQALIALGQQLERLQKGGHVQSEECRVELETLRQATRDQVLMVRRLIGDLRPPYLEDLGLVPALEMLAKDQPGPQPPEVTVQGQARRLPPDLELTVYRIVQAALQNVEQHARSSHVRVQLEFEERAARVVVEDDGPGFTVPDSPDELARQGHFGLLGMRERAMLFGGWLALTSQPGKGTRVEAYLPEPSAPEGSSS